MKNLVDIHNERCIGCTRCMRSCPMEAIRIVDNKAQLFKERCIYCGNCIIECHKNAYKVYSDSFANLSKYKINVAILPIAIYGLLNNKDDLGGISATLKDYGFDEVVELSGIYSFMVDQILDYIKNDDKTYILTHCPSVTRLVTKKYPQLLHHLLPFSPPFEIAGKVYRRFFSEKYNLQEDEIGISYISECLSNFIVIKENKDKIAIDQVFLLSDLIRNISYKKIDEVKAVKKGVYFAKVGAFKYVSNNRDILAVDGIRNVDTVLEHIDIRKIKNVRLVEAYSCTGGCVGGTFMQENPFVAKWRVNEFINELDDDVTFDINIEPIDYYAGEFESEEGVLTLSNDFREAIKKLKRINEILAILPNIDCCACGSPSCRAFAEDVVKGLKTIEDCRMRKGGT